MVKNKRVDSPGIPKSCRALPNHMGFVKSMFSPQSLAAWGVAFGVMYYTTPSNNKTNSRPAPAMTQKEISEINSKKNEINSKKTEEGRNEW